MVMDVFVWSTFFARKMLIYGQSIGKPVVGVTISMYGLQLYVGIW